jgi:ribonuclease-3
MVLTVTTYTRELAGLEETIGHVFASPELLRQAVTHSSQAREIEAVTPTPAERAGDNEQLEFLGDAVLGLVTTEELFRRFPEFTEGQLSKLRAHLVSKNHLINVAERLDLGKYLRLGRGEEKSGGRNKTALLVDALEAVNDVANHGHIGSPRVGGSEEPPYISYLNVGREGLVCPLPAVFE